ncbi:MAG: hypothetical protein RMJ45_00860 [Candidatus Calescibacterium sp.]|nr:hypothetical protein [Candidatus Calescibacterium sp.]
MQTFEVNQEDNRQLHYYCSRNKIQDALVGVLSLLSLAKTPLTVGYP